MPTHKKGQDRDKYYQLAKDQGYRSRAAFKLIQINKRYDILRKAKVCIDLCAAPGGWCQVAAKYMPQGSLVLGVDLLPIKALRGVKTIVGDITTASTRKAIVSELQGWKADVVLCDGAPNIGSAYNKDAFVQNELVLAALKTATEHLNKGGTFITKVYRSVDYNSLVWALQQLFSDIQTMKPNSSRSQSSEIFLICLAYTAPNSIDPKLFDPNFVFKEVQDPGLKGPDVLHKKYDSSYKRQRSGYDENLGITLHSKMSASDFIHSKEPVRLLTDVHEITFSTDACKQYLEHEKTTKEIQLALSDLKVLGKIDFKKLLKWRQRMIDDFHSQKEDSDDEEDDEGSEDEEVEEERDPEQAILEEIDHLRMLSEKEKRKEVKKERKVKRKERVRQSLGMHHNAFEVAEDTELFTLNSNVTKKDVEEMNEVPLDASDNLYIQALAEEEGLLEDEDEEEEEIEVDKKRRKLLQKKTIFLPDDNMDDELEEDYLTHTTKSRLKNALREKELKKKLEDKELEQRTLTMKKALKAQTPAAKLQQLQDNDEALLASVENEDENEYEDDLGEDQVVKKKGKDKDEKLTSLQDDLQNYMELLAGKNKSQKKKRENQSESEDSDSSDDEEEDEDNGRMVTKDIASIRARTGKWFANPIFNPSNEKVVSFENEEDDEEDADANSEEDDSRFDFMPKTDKEKRQDKRRKDKARQEKKNLKRNRDLLAAQEDEDNDDDDRAGKGKKAMRIDGGIKIVAADIPQDILQSVQQTTEEIKQKRAKISKTPATNADGSIVVAPKSILKKGKEEINSESKNQREFEVVSQEESTKMIEESFPRVDQRSYDSDNEEYDAHDRIMTMALGTYMLRNSKKKALIDASYNRYSWNDPEGLPSWFLDDELRHNKPQVPVPHALVEQIKNKYQLTGTKVIKKEVEARARKKKRAMLKLKAAKKQATVMAENSELSEKQKLKAIAKAVRNTKDVKTSKIYVTTKKTKSGSVGQTLGGEGTKGKLKFVDKRMKKDRRALKAKDRRSKR